MPSPRKPHRICFFGDSQMGSLRNALRDGLTAAPERAEVEFWGATGPSFRLIEWRNGAIRAKDRALEMALTINGNGREALAAQDFDTVIFYGARLRVTEFFGPYLHWMDETGQIPSVAVLRASARMFAVCTRAYRMAGALAKAGCNVIYVPAPFYTEGVNDIDRQGRFLGIYPGAANATAERRLALWTALVEVAAQDGIALVPQPEDTVTRGSLTHNDYAHEDALELGDTGHKSPAFAARWMQEVWPLTESRIKAA
jgi:hypothetical protein